MIPILNYFASSCGEGSFFGFPTWYHYFINNPNTWDSNTCTPVIKNLGDIWLIVAAIIEILLRLAAIAAVVFVIYGGVMYATSQGSPDQTSKAKSTIINALIGLALSIAASVIIAFIAGSI